MYKYIIVIRARLCPVTWVEDAWIAQNEHGTEQRYYRLTRQTEDLAKRFDTKEEAQEYADDIYEGNKQYGLTPTIQAVLK